MRNFFFLSLVALLSLFLVGCRERGTAQVVVTPIKEIPSPVSSQVPLAQPSTATPDAEVLKLPQYEIVARIDFDKKILEVQQDIAFPNTGDVAISSMLLAIQPNRIPDVFKLTALRLDDQEVINYRLNGQRLQWQLESALQPGHVAKIHIEYLLALPAIEEGDPNVIRPQIFGVTPMQVNLTDWYPMLVPYDPETGWRLADPWYYGEHLVYPLANFDVRLHFVDPSRAPMVAASALAQPEAGGMRYILENGRGFTLTMSRELRVMTDEVGGVIVLSYYYSGDEEAARAVLATTEKSIKTFSALFGRYPHKSLSAVQGDFKDGMEFDGLYYLSGSLYELYDGTENNYLTMIAAHETSHQWWFSRVASDQAEQPWMDEALATYCEKLYYEMNHPESIDWWWATRINFYAPRGKIDGDVPSYDGFTPYTNATYRSGARFFEDLRLLIGDEAFFAFLHDYADLMDGKIATSDDFIQILRRHSSVDTSALFSKYFANLPITK